MAEFRYRTLRENVADAIRMKILDQELAPGMHIVEQDLAEEFGVSRAPVREALRQLEQEGMIEYSRNVGCSVKGVTLEDVYEIYFLRAHYEIMAVRLCGGRFSDEALNNMERTLDYMKEMKNGQFHKVAEYDIMFHEAVIRQAESPRLIKAWKDLNYGVVISCYISYTDRDIMIGRQYRIHRELFDIFRSEDADRICDAIITHYGMTSMRNMRENGGRPTKFNFALNVFE